MGRSRHPETPEGEDGPIAWTMWFGVWFLIYHVVWYGHLIGEHAEPNTMFAYPARRFASDLVGVAGLLGGFAALGLASGQYHLYLPGVFLAAGFIPLSALLGHRHRRLGNSALIIIAGLAAATGVAAHLGANAGVLTSLDITLLREFWLVLLAYLFVPSVFGTAEHTRRRADSPARSTASNDRLVTERATLGRTSPPSPARTRDHR